ncbi:MAG: InlB B-repeat-containing protein, partial [Christensenellales bacterium]
GYTFTGWLGSYSNVKKNETVTATYSINSYTVTFVDWDGETLETRTVNYGSSATPPADPAREGYTFTGWLGSYSNVTSDITVTATYSINSYTVTFVDWDGETLETRTVNYGSSATPPADPAREGYTFTGWLGSYSNVTSDITVTAVYSINSYTVKFVDWDGETLETRTVNYGGSATPPADPVREGYTFAGWSGSYSNVKKNETVTATYSINSYTVTFVDWDGETLETRTVNYGSSAIPPADPVREGYTFMGWLGSYSNVTSDITVTAVYSINSYTVTFVDWDGETLETRTVNYGGSATPPSDPVREGYTFAGWLGSYSNVKKNETITATYSINSYTVTFVDWDGKTLETRTVNYGSSATPPADPTREGYTFAGWLGSYSNVKKNETVTAAYTIKRFTVTFNVGSHGTVSPTSPNGLVQTVDYNGDALPPEINPDPGYNFLGWDVSYGNVTDNITVTARYVIKHFTLTVNVKGNGMVTDLAGIYNYGTVIDLDTVATTSASGYEFSRFVDANGNAIKAVSMYGNRTITAIFTAVSADSSTASPTPSASIQPTQDIPEDQIPQAAFGQNQGQAALGQSQGQAALGQNQGQTGGFSGYWFFLIIGLPLVILAMVILFKRRRKKKSPQ